MSQEKVERYKEQKANRKEILEKERKNKKRTKTIVILSLVLIIGAVGTAIGFTIYNEYQSYLAALPDYSRTVMVLDDWSGMLDEETEDVEDDGTEETSGDVDSTKGDAEETESGETTADQTQEDKSAEETAASETESE